jgi:hypothetical protein
MAVEKNIRINVETRTAVADIKKLRSETDAAQADLRKTIPIDLDATQAKTTLSDVGAKAKDTAKDVKDIDTNAQDSKKGFKTMKDGILSVNTALKAMGIGLVIAAFVKLQEALGKNQVVMDKLSVASEAIGFVFKKLIDFALDLSEKISDAFTSPQDALKSFWEALKQNVVNRVTAVIDLFGALGTVIQGVFKKDLDLIKEGAKEAGGALAQMTTGVTPEQFEKIGEAIKNTTAEIKKSTKAAVEYGKAITALRNEVKLAEANQRQLQLTYQRDAELQRQIRDDISLTFEERIAANEELGRILDEQFAEEQALAQKKVALAELELSANKTNIDLQVALINAKTELADLDERITGQRSEQLVNLKALEAEQAAAIKETADAEAKRLEDARAAADEAVRIADAEAKKKIEIERALAATRRDIVSNSLGQVASLLGEQSKAGKALAVGQALINTYSAAAAALAPPPIGAGPIFGPIAAIGAVAAGMANVKQILSTKLPGDSGGGGGGGPEPAVPQDTGLGPMSPNMEAVEQPTLGGGSQPAQAYVVENDISNAQALQNELDIQATL